MHDPYKMVFVNLLGSLLVLTGIFFYIYIFPKRKVNFFILVVILALLPLLSLLRPGDYESGDFNIHIYRIMSFYDSLKEGIFMPSWAAELNATYGNPLFIFNYSLPYYFISLFHFIGFSFITSMKLYLAITYVLSGIFMYLWFNKLSKNNLAAFASSIFYLYNPYHLIDVHFRATLGECTVFAIAPLVLLCITLYFQKKKLYLLFFTSLVTLLLILGHPLLAIVILGIVFIYSVCLAKIRNDYKSFAKITVSLIIGSLGSIYLWVPFILYSPYMYPNPSPQLNFNPYYELFFSPWRYGFLFQGPQGELALMIGYSQLLIVLGGVYLFFKSQKKPLKIYLSVWLLIFFLFLFILSPLSRFFWNYFPIFWMLIPTGRLLLAVALCTSVIGGYVVLSLSDTKKQKLFILIFLILTIGITILNWGHRRVIPAITDETLRQGVWKSTVTEGITAYFLNNKWADKNHFWFSELPKQHLEIIDGRADFNQINRYSLTHTYVVNAKTPLTIKENTLFFPGWSLKSNNKSINIYPGKRGIIYAKLPKGLQYLELSYDDLFIYKISKILSAGVLCSLIFGLFISVFTPNPKHLSRKS
jgi:hypothetical protein